MEDVPSFKLAKQLWDQRVQATSKNHVSACSEQWELMVEVGNAHASAIMELMKDVSAVKSELNRQKGEVKGCVNSLMLLDRRSAERSERLVKEHHEKMAEGLDGLEEKRHLELEALEKSLVSLFNCTLKREQALSQEAESRAACLIELKEGQRHSSSLEEALRQQQERVSRGHEHAGRLQAELDALRAFIDEQDTQLARVSRELLAEIKLEHDKRVVQIREELRHLDAGLRRCEEARGADVQDARAEMQQMPARTRGQMQELERRLQKFEEASTVNSLQQLQCQARGLVLGCGPVQVG